MRMMPDLKYLYSHKAITSQYFFHSADAEIEMFISKDFGQ